MGFIPLLVYVLSYLNAIKADYLFPISTTLTALTFLFIGFLPSYVTNTSRFKSIAETLFLGGIAALLAYFVGSILENILLWNAEFPAGFKHNCEKRVCLK